MRMFLNAMKVGLASLYLGACLVVAGFSLLLRFVMRFGRSTKS